MTNKLEEIQEENRKFIIMANNPTAETYQRALEMEVGFGCHVILNGYNFPIKLTYETILRGHYGWGNENSDFHKYIKILHDGTEEYVEKIIGKPLTLDRVLIAFKSMELGYLNGFLFQIDTNIDSRHEDEKKIICEWDLTKETLEEQSEETQKEINRIINLN